MSQDSSSRTDPLTRPDLGKELIKRIIPRKWDWPERPDLDNSALFVEIDRTSATACSWPGCDKEIEAGTYRFSHSPSHPRDIESFKRRGTVGCFVVVISLGHADPVAEFYHIKCFESTADPGRPDILNYLQPLTRRWVPDRENPAAKYVLDAGAECLVLDWTQEMVVFYRDSDACGWNKPGPKRMKICFRIYQMRSALQGEPPGTKAALSRVEQDGPGDRMSWDVGRACQLYPFQRSRRMSHFLGLWQDLQRVGLGEDVAGQQLSPKAIRGIQRLSKIPPFPESETDS